MPSDNEHNSKAKKAPQAAHSSKARVSLDEFDGYEDQPAPASDTRVLIRGAWVGDITAWHGKPCYQCRWCAFATLDERILAEHVRERHPKEVRQAVAESRGTV